MKIWKSEKNMIDAMHVYIHTHTHFIYIYISHVSNWHIIKREKIRHKQYLKT